MAFTGEPCAVAVRAKGVAGTEGESLMLLTCGQMDAGESAAALNCVMKNIAVRSVHAFDMNTSVDTAA